VVGYFLNGNICANELLNRMCQLCVTLSKKRTGATGGLTWCSPLETIQTLLNHPQQRCTGSPLLINRVSHPWFWRLFFASKQACLHLPYRDFDGRACPVSLLTAIFWKTSELVAVCRLRPAGRSIPRIFGTSIATRRHVSIVQGLL
jgi:hypothetical protein